MVRAAHCCSSLVAVSTACLCAPVCQGFHQRFSTQETAPHVLQGYGYIPPPPSEREAVWTDQVWGASVPTNRKIFCNRSLNMKQIKVRVREKCEEQEWVGHKIEQQAQVWHSARTVTHWPLCT